MIGTTFEQGRMRNSEARGFDSLHLHFAVRPVTGQGGLD